MCSPADCAAPSLVDKITVGLWAARSQSCASSSRLLGLWIRLSLVSTSVGCACKSRASCVLDVVASPFSQKATLSRTLATRGFLALCRATTSLSPSLPSFLGDDVAFSPPPILTDDVAAS